MPFHKPPKRVVIAMLRRAFSGQTKKATMACQIKRALRPLKPLFLFVGHIWATFALRFLSFLRFICFRGCQSLVDRPCTPHACKRSPSVRLPRRFQFCKSGPISLRSLDRITLAKRGKCAADIFTQGSTSQQALSTTAAFKAPGMRGSHIL